MQGKDGYYQMCLPFRNPNLVNFHEDYITFLEEVISEGYARKVLPDVVEIRRWGLYHTTIRSPIKFASFSTVQPSFKGKKRPYEKKERPLGQGKKVRHSSPPFSPLLAQGLDPPLD